MKKHSNRGSAKVKRPREAHLMSPMVKLGSPPPALPPRHRKFELKPASTVKDHRKGTARALALTLLLKGTTLDRVMKLTGWTHRQAVEGIRLINRQLGYGIKEDESGKILATRKQSKR